MVAMLKGWANTWGLNTGGAGAGSVSSVSIRMTLAW